MAKKTNKTSHVLNLITGGTTEPEAEKQTSQALPSEQKVVVVDSAKEEQIAGDIRRQLLNEVGDQETELEKHISEVPDQPEEASEIPGSRGSSTGESISEESISEESISEGSLSGERVSDNSTLEESSGKEPVVETPALKTPALEKTDTAPQNADAAPEEEIPYRMINVMEEILSPEVVRAEMEKYGVCLCSRCQADVLALLLTRLPAKYIVANTTAISPLLSYYKNKFRVNLLTQTIKACTEVREHPRHERKNSYDSEKFADN